MKQDFVKLQFDGKEWKALGTETYDVYEYVWGNNEKRKTMKGRKCIVLHRLAKNSCIIQFIDCFTHPQLECVSRNALRRVK